MFGSNKSPFTPYAEPSQQLFGSQDPADPMTAFASSPWMSMANSAITNMSAMRRGHMPQGDPTQAYQKAVVAQSMANQQKRQQELAQQKAQQGLQIGEQTMEMNRQKLNPFYSFEEAKRRKIIPEDMSLAEWENINRANAATAPEKNFERREQLVAELESASTPEQKEEIQQRIDVFDNYVRSISPYGGGGGSQYIRMPDGSIRELVGADVATQRESNLAGGKQEAEEIAKTSAQQVREGMAGARSARTMYEQADNMLRNTDEYLQRFSGQEEIETGWIPGMLMNTFGIGTEAIGELTADSVHAALINLGITNLAPVTEQEFASVMKMWADISASPSANKGMLTAAKRRTERLMEQLREEAIYNAGIVEEFGSAGQFGAFRRSNPFVDRLMTDPNDDPEIP